MALKKLNLKRRRKYTGTCFDNKRISALCAETRKTLQQCYNIAGRHKGNVMRIKKVLNSTGSWNSMGYSLLRCDGVYQVGQADGGDSFPSDIRTCQTAHDHIPDMGF